MIKFKDRYKNSVNLNAEPHFYLLANIF